MYGSKGVRERRGRPGGGVCWGHGRAPFCSNDREGVDLPAVESKLGTFLQQLRLHGHAHDDKRVLHEHLQPFGDVLDLQTNTYSNLSNSDKDGNFSGREGGGVYRAGEAYGEVVVVGPCLSLLRPLP